ncbi:MAG: type VI secretion system baseplate subunit TssF [Burkholderiales bacterium]|nr:type VI secretion system baseplate subunit TssF [Burkholderiales bacterium]
MDPRLVDLYKAELTHLREMGVEFAHEFPKIAARLGIEGATEVADPYVERLLEGFAFLTARVQLKLQAEHPQLIAHLLESSYPNFLAPVPSMVIARLGVDPTDPNLARGHTVPRGAALLSLMTRGQETRCEFRTAQAVTLWPIELQSVQYFSHAADLPLAQLPQARGMRGGLRIRLRAGGGTRFGELGIDSLRFYLSANDDVAYRLYELLLGAAIGSWVNGGAPGVPAQPQWRDEASVQPCGFAADEALLPESLRAFSGHRLLQEVAALPQRLLFFELTDLAARLATVGADTVDLVILFSRGDPALESLVDGASLALFCTPAINLFWKRLDRVQLEPGNWEFHLVPDRTRPMDYEVHSLDTVVGHGSGQDAKREFKPLYATHDAQAPDAHGYFSLRRETRLLSQRQRLHGVRSRYIGEEAFLSLVDADHGAYREALHQLSVTAWVTNRDLPTLLPAGAGSGAVALWKLESSAPVLRVDALRGPTPPVSRRPSGDVGWRLVSQLKLNHLSLDGESPEQAAADLRSALRLYGPPEDPAWARQIEGVRSLQAQPVVRRLPFKGPLTHGSGIELVLELDDLAFQGSSAFVLASVLECFFARHAAINSFIQLTLRTPQRGIVKRWPPRIGQRAVL